MKIGDPLDRSVQHGPQNHLAHLTKLVEYCEAGLREGARLILGGKRCNRWDISGTQAPCEPVYHLGRVSSLSRRYSVTWRMTCTLPRRRALAL